ncbi:MAG: hypothetical protein KBT34_05375 [Prevotella sp.]|nr:hypothetical protein [Candidatus Prevotella equi]
MKKFTTENLEQVLGYIKTLVSNTKTEITTAYTNLVGILGNDKNGNAHTVKSYVDAAIESVNGDNTALAGRVKDIEDAKGVANGLASLDENGHVPSSQLPSFVDDVLEYANFAAFPSTGEAGKIYVSKDDNLTYRWTGTQYTEISKSLALGETSSTAYAGDKGKQLADNLSMVMGEGEGSFKKAVKDLSDGQVKVNKDAIDSINNETTGILAQAKADATNKANTAEQNAKNYADQQIEAIAAYTEAEIKAAWDKVFNAAA